jgi:hypothetical protein
VLLEFFKTLLELEHRVGLFNKNVI